MQDQAQEARPDSPSEAYLDNSLQLLIDKSESESFAISDTETACRQKSLLPTDFASNSNLGQAFGPHTDAFPKRPTLATLDQNIGPSPLRIETSIQIQPDLDKHVEGGV